MSLTAYQQQLPVQEEGRAAYQYTDNNMPDRQQYAGQQYRQQYAARSLALIRKGAPNTEKMDATVACNPISTNDEDVTVACILHSRTPIA